MFEVLVLVGEHSIVLVNVSASRGDTRHFLCVQIVFVGDKVLLETLLEEIDVDQLPKVYGGRKELVPIQFAVTPNWPPKHMEASQTS